MMPPLLVFVPSKNCPIRLWKAVTTRMLLLLLLLSSAPMHLHRASALDNGLAASAPPMGISTWTVFRADINHSLMVGLADSMTDLGLDGVGYTYLLMDAGWTAVKPNCEECLPHRNETGHLHVDPAKFDDLRSTIDYVHQKGLSFGIWYGFEMCDTASFPDGDYDRYATLDADYFASMGVDALKHDICDAAVANTTRGRARNLRKFRVFGDALNATGRPILYDVSLIVSKPRELPAYDYNYVYSPEPYGSDAVQALANTWWSVPVNKYNCWKCCVHPQEFIVDDKDCDDPTKLAAWRGLLPMLDVQDMRTPGWKGHWDWAGSGKGWNHLDQLSSCVMGESWYGPGLTPEEQVAQISLWAIVASPLIVPPDTRRVRVGDFCHSLISNPKMIRVHQDPAGIPGRPVKSIVLAADRKEDGPSSAGGRTAGEVVLQGQLWARPLSRGAVAVLLFNRSERRILMEAAFEEIGAPFRTARAVNVWTDEVRSRVTSPVSASVAPHSVSFWILTPAHRAEGGEEE